MASEKKPLPRFRVKKPPQLSRHPAPGYVLRGRLWVEKDGEVFLGPGRIALLEQIDRLKSISGAARAMNMGYRHAWLLVETMNRLARAPLVEKSVGGRDGGSARLTPEGRRALEDFKSLYQTFRDFVSDKDA